MFIQPPLMAKTLLLWLWSFSRLGQALAVRLMASRLTLKELMVDSMTARCPNHHPSTTVLTFIMRYLCARYVLPVDCGAPPALAPARNHSPVVHHLVCLSLLEAVAVSISLLDCWVTLVSEIPDCIIQSIPSCFLSINISSLHIDPVPLSLYVDLPD